MILFNYPTRLQHEATDDLLKNILICGYIPINKFLLVTSKVN